MSKAFFDQKAEKVKELPVVIAVNSYLSFKYIVVKRIRATWSTKSGRDNGRGKILSERQSDVYTLVPHNNQKISKTGEAESEIRIILIYK